MQSLNEPEIGYLYKMAGFLAMLAFFVAGVASLVWHVLVPVPPVVLFLASALAGAVLFAGLATSEAWYIAMRRRYIYSSTIERYSTHKLSLFVAGISVVTLVAVLLVLR